jgi:hypothetical protein
VDRCFVYLLIPQGVAQQLLYLCHVEWLMLYHERSNLGNRQMYYFCFLRTNINDYLFLSWLIFRLVCAVYVWAVTSSVLSGCAVCVWWVHSIQSIIKIINSLYPMLLHSCHLHISMRDVIYKPHFCCRPTSWYRLASWDMFSPFY